MRRLLFCFGLRWRHASTQFASRELCAVAMRRCHCLCRRGWLAFPRTIGLQIWQFLTFCEDRSTQSLAKMLRHNQIQDGGAGKVETATIWPFFAHETSRSWQITLLWDVVTFRGFNRGRSNSAHTFYEDNRNFSPQCVIERSFTQIPGVTKACLPIFGSSFTYIVFPVTHCGERCVIWTNFTW